MQSEGSTSGASGKQNTRHPEFPENFRKLRRTNTSPSEIPEPARYCTGRAVKTEQQGGSAIPVSFDVVQANEEPQTRAFLSFPEICNSIQTISPEVPEIVTE
jgi:hypothetical protein